MPGLSNGALLDKRCKDLPEAFQGLVAITAGVVFHIGRVQSRLGLKLLEYVKIRAPDPSGNSGQGVDIDKGGQARGAKLMGNAGMQNCLDAIGNPVGDIFFAYLGRIVFWIGLDVHRDVVKKGVL